jgi:hypothetical protein
VTLEQVEARQRKAVNFARNALQDDDLADSLEDEDPRDYAERERLTISNSPQRRTTNVANGNDMTKADLQDCVDQATQILTDAYVPESTREDLAAAIGDALAALEGDTGDGEDDDDTDDDQD